MIPCACCPLETDCHGVNGDPSQPVYGFRCDGVARWYDSNGDEVPVSSVARCGEQPAAVPSLLTMTPSFFGDGPDPLGENLCGFSTPPDVLNDWTAQPGGCFDPTTSGQPLGWTSPITSLTFEYGNQPRTSGGVFTTWSSPQMGGTVTWPTTTFLNPGDTVVSNPGTAGRRWRFTYLSGPSGATNGNRPHFNSNQLRFHLASTDNTTPPTRVRFDFLPS